MKTDADVECLEMLLEYINATNLVSLTSDINEKNLMGKKQ